MENSNYKQESSRTNPFKGFKPFPNQRDNILRLISQRKALLSDKVGSGKTMSIVGAFGTLYMRGQLRWLIVLMPCNAYDKKVWQKDIDKFTSLRVLDIENLNDLKQIDECDVLICKHTHLKSEKFDIIKMMVRDPSVMIAVDEAHAFKNPKAEVSKLMQEVMDGAHNAWFITGTTLSRNIEDTYWLLSLLQKGLLYNFNKFRSVYCVTKDIFLGKLPNGEPKKAKKIVGIKGVALLHKVIDPYIIVGKSFVTPKYHYVTYSLSDKESELYQAVSCGIDIRPDMSDEEWIEECLKTNDANGGYIKDVERFSSRFLYLQSCADGFLSADGKIQDNGWSSKLFKFLGVVNEVVNKGQSILVYFDYLESLNIVKGVLEKVFGDKVDIHESTSKHKLKDGVVTEDSVKVKPTIILGTRASSESVSYYYINNVCFFQIPTVPSTFVQFVGRITRRNTFYPDDLNVYIMQSSNIDSYKLTMVGYKVWQMEQVQGEEENFPSLRKVSDVGVVDLAKQQLLWRKGGKIKVINVM